MNVNLNEYFKLGLDSTNNPTIQAGLINTIRTPSDTSSQNANRISFKVPKIGMLTADSHINLRFTTSGATNVQLNLINGALGCVKRMRILLGNKVLTDVERPGLHSVPHLYSRNTLQQLADYYREFIGCNYVLKTRLDNGTNILDRDINVGMNDAGDYYTKNSQINETRSRTYALPLKLLGADFLSNASLPVFLLQEKEMIIELEFDPVSNNWCFEPNGTLVAGKSVFVDIDKCELVSTHIQIPDEVELQQLDAIKSRPAQYPLMDVYSIKAVIPAGTNGVANSNLYRLNVQNREVHKLLMVLRPLDETDTQIMANQCSLGGDISIQMKVNGLNYFEKTLTNSAVQYQVLKDYLDGLSLKFPFEIVKADFFQANQQVIGSEYVENIGRQDYMGFDFGNGNQGIFGSGTIMKSALEIEHTLTPRTAVATDSANARDLLFYVQVSKMLTIGDKMINVSF